MQVIKLEVCVEGLAWEWGQKDNCIHLTQTSLFIAHCEPTATKACHACSCHTLV